MPDGRSSAKCIPATTPGFLQKMDVKWDEPRDFYKSLLREVTINKMILKSNTR